MKRIRTLLALLLVLTLGASLCACGNNAEKMAALAGTWTMTGTDTQESIMELMESIDAYDAEIALVDMTSLKYVQLVTFDTKGNYTFADDPDATRACVREFYEGYFAALYAGRTTLNAVYETTFDNMTEAEFQQYYAEVYDCANYEALLDLLTENAHNYEVLESPWETGTYTIRGNRIYCTITGQSKAEYINYSVSADTLTLTYSNLEEVYTRVK